MAYSITTKVVFNLICAASLVSLATALHLEWSTQFVQDALHEEREFLNELIGREWAVLGQESVAPTLKYKELSHRNAADGSANTIEFVFPGELDEGKAFTAVMKVST